MNQLDKDFEEVLGGEGLAKNKKTGDIVPNNTELLDKDFKALGLDQDFNRTSLLEERKVERTKDDVESLESYGVPLKVSQSDSWDEQRAQNQSTLSKLGNGVAQAAGEIIGGTLEGVGYVTDVQDMYNYATGVNKEFNNWLSELGQAVKSKTDKAAPIYMTQLSHADDLLDRMSSASYWASNFKNIASTLSFMVPTMGIVGGLSKVARLAKIGEEVGMMGKMVMKGLTGAIVSRQMESMQEAYGVFEKLYKEGLEKGYDDDKARTIAGKGASLTYTTNWLNLATDLPQYMMMYGGLNAARAKMVGEGLLGKITESTAAGFATGMASEGLEEGSQYVMQKEGERYGHQLMGEKVDQDSFWTRVGKYTEDNEFADSVVLGALGGGLFHAISEVKNNIQDKGRKQENVALEMKRAALRNDHKSYEGFKDQAFYDHISSKAKMGRFDQAMDEFDFLLSESDENLETMMGAKEHERADGTKIPIREFIEKRKEQAVKFEKEYNRLANKYGVHDVRTIPLVTNYMNQELLQDNLNMAVENIAKHEAETARIAGAEGKLAVNTIKAKKLEVDRLADQIRELTEENEKIIKSGPEKKSSKKQSKRAGTIWEETMEQSEARLAKLIEDKIDAEEEFKNAYKEFREANPERSAKEIQEDLAVYYNSENATAMWRKTQADLIGRLDNLRADNKHLNSKEAKAAMEKERDDAVKAEKKAIEDKKKAEADAKAKAKEDEAKQSRTQAAVSATEAPANTVQGEPLDVDAEGNPVVYNISGGSNQADAGELEDSLLRELEELAGENKGDESLGNVDPEKLRAYRGNLDKVQSILDKFQKLGITKFEDIAKYLAHKLPTEKARAIFLPLRASHSSMLEANGEMELAAAVRDTELDGSRTSHKEAKAIEENLSEADKFKDGEVQNLKDLNSVLAKDLKEEEAWTDGSVTFLGDKTVLSAQSLAYLSRPYERQAVTAGTHMDIIKRNTGNEKNPNLKTELESNTNYLPGTELSLEIDKTFVGDVTVYDKISNTHITKTMKYSDYVRPDGSVDVENVPIAIKNIDGDIVAYLHTTEWVARQSSTGSYENTAHNPELGIFATEQIINITRLREAIIKSNGSVKTTIIGKSQGKLHEYMDKGKKAYGTMDKLMPDKTLPILAVRRGVLYYNSGNEYSEPGVELMNDMDKIAAAEGVVFTSVPMPNGKYMALPLLTPQINSEMIESIVQAIKGHLTQDKKLADRIFAESSIDISSVLGLRDYIQRFIHTERFSDLDWNNTSRHSSKKYFDVGASDARLVLSFTTQGYKPSVIANIAEFEKHEAKLRAQLKDTLLAVRLTRTNRPEEFKLPLINERGEVIPKVYTEEQGQSPYNNFLREHLKTNIQASEIESSGEWSYADQPVILFDAEQVLTNSFYGSLTIEEKKDLSESNSWSEEDIQRHLKETDAAKPKKRRKLSEDSLSAYPYYDDALSAEEQNKLESALEDFIIPGYTSNTQQEVVDYLFAHVYNEYKKGSSPKAAFDLAKEIIDENAIAPEDSTHTDEVELAKEFKKVSENWTRFQTMTIKKFEALGLKIKGAKITSKDEKGVEVTDSVEEGFTGLESNFEKISFDDSASFQIDSKDTSSYRMKLFLANIAVQEVVDTDLVKERYKDLLNSGNIIEDCK